MDIPITVLVDPTTLNVKGGARRFGIFIDKYLVLGPVPRHGLSYRHRVGNWFV